MMVLSIGERALRSTFNVLSESAIASGKPLTLLVEAKYKSDKSHSLIIDYLAKHADQEIQLLEYNSKENPQVTVNEVVRRTAKLRR